MFPTVAEVLELEPVRRGVPEVVAGSAGLATPVRWAHVSELPDIGNLLHGGELVLTTGIALPKTTEGLVRYVDDLADIGAAGLVVELGRRFKRQLPRSLVGAAERRHTALVQLHRRTQFVTVTEALHTLIINAQLRELRASAEVHEIFTELSVEGAEPDEIVRQLARLAGRPVVLENLAHQVLSHDSAGEEITASLLNWEGRSRTVRLEHRTEFIADLGWLVSVVGARGQDWGRVVMLCHEPPGPRHRNLLERAASALAINHLVVRDRESLERQTHRTLLTSVLTHTLPMTELAVRARAVGVPLERRILVGVILRLGTSTMLEPRSQDQLRDLAHVTQRTLRTRGVKALVSTVDERTVAALIALEPTEPEEPVLTLLADTLNGLDWVGRVVIGVGSTVSSISAARRSLEEARHAADAASGQSGRAPYYRLPDVGLRGFLYMLRDDPRLQTYVEQALGSLLAHDARHGTELVSTLAHFLRAGCNKSAAAQAAHLSRPSFYERLGRIRRILGVDPAAVGTRLSLHVALVALDILRSTESTPDRCCSLPSPRR
ncbi:MAG: PucR family transcriptional regulator [Streptosporangiales bacterium]|nr:PucR family transcriptional regulator [Streptosporangiales bacterium]